jgi:hypothetical protein
MHRHRIEERCMGIDAKVRDSHFHLNGVNYFRGHADAVQLGDVGEKKTPATQENYLAVQESVPRRKLKIERATQIDIHGLALGSSDIGASITIPGVGVLGAGSVARQLEDQTLALVKLETLPKDIVAAANDSPDVITELIRAGKAGRLVHQSFVILEMKTALNFTRATRFELSGTVKSWTVTATGGSAGASRTVVTITPGTTFAYLLLKPKWDANLKKNWTRIDDWEDDQWSLY